jgi:hypothetical protein
MLDNTGASTILTNTTQLPGITVTIPDQTVAFGPTSWDGTLIPPSPGTISSAPSGFHFGSTYLDLGSPNNLIFFDKAVLITLPTKITSLSYQPGGTTSNWNSITGTCGGTYAVPSALPFPTDCFITQTIPAGTKILTWHFTTFAELIPNPVPPTFSEEKQEPAETPEQEANEVPVVTPTTPITPTTPVSQIITYTLADIESSPIPPFNSLFGANFPAGRINWALEHRANIYRAYQDILGRTPSPSEVNWWLTQSDDINLIRYEFLTSDEYKSKH